MKSFDPRSVEEVWSLSFTFAGVNPSEWEKRKSFWKACAQEIAALLAAGRRPVVRLGTGGGKTIIALLASVALGARTLFLVPTRYLAGQHFELLLDTLGYVSLARVITGETPDDRRVWDDRRERFVFATADAFYAALAQRKASPALFDLVIFDEMHRTSGQYPYVHIAPTLLEAGVAHMGLSASPGSSEEEVELVLHTGGFDTVTSFECNMREKGESYYFLSLPQEMQRADVCGWQPLGEEIVRLLYEAHLHLPPGWRPSASELDTLFTQISALPPSRNTKHLRKVFAKYRLYLYGRFVFMTGSYHAFLAYTDKLAIRKRPSDRALLGEPLFGRLIATARAYYDQHPKVLKLERMLRTLARTHERAIVFFADKETAQYCKDFLTARDVPVETVFGGAGKSIKKQHEAIAKLKDGTVTALLATSVLHEGVSIPEVDLVLNYSVASSGIIRLQSSGRTGRMYKGYVAHLVLDHELDRQLFFGVHHELDRMQELTARELLPSQARQGQQSLFVS
jgi:ERCC4-related helicase